MSNTPAVDPSGFDASVLMSVLVIPEPDTIILDITLEITATNITGAPVGLTHPYEMVTRYAQALEAWDKYGKLPVVTHPHKTRNLPTSIPRYEEQAVYFPGRDPIPPGESHTWHLKFKRRVKDHINNDLLLILRYPLRVQHQFQGMRVRSHRFTCNFHFMKPKTDQWRKFKKFVPILRDDHKVIAGLEHRPECTICHLEPFDVGHGSSPTLEFICIYQFARLWSNVLSSVVTIVAALLIEMVRRIVVDRILDG